MEFIDVVSKDENGMIKVDLSSGSIKFLQSDVEVKDGLWVVFERKYANALKWIWVNDKYHLLVKGPCFNAVFDDEMELVTKLKGNIRAENIALYNNMLLPYLGNIVFRVDTTKNFICNDPNTNKKCLLSMDARRDGEEFVEWKEFFWGTSKQKLIDQTLFSERIEKMRKYCDEKNESQDNIRKIEDNVIMQEIFKKFIEYKDNSLVNMSLGVDDEQRKIRMGPVYDFDFCSGVTNVFYGYNGGDSVTKCDNYQRDLKSFIMQYKDRRGIKEYIKMVIDNFNMDNVFSKLLEETRN